MAAKTTKAAKKPTKTVKKTTKKARPARIAFVLDRSGSMADIWESALKSLNGFVTEQKNIGAKTTFTLVFFDDQYETFYADVPIESVKEITPLDVQPRAMTALYDAIGKTINSMGESPKGTDTIIAVMTDGHENASREYDLEKVKNIVKSAQGKKWQVVFLGANLDVAAFSGATGLRVGSTMQYAPTNAGISGAMMSMTMGVANYRTGATMSVDLTNQPKANAEEK